jgi:hypothetical protein
MTQFTMSNRETPSRIGSRPFSTKTLISMTKSLTLWSPQKT